MIYLKISNSRSRNPKTINKYPHHGIWVKNCRFSGRVIEVPVAVGVVATGIKGVGAGVGESTKGDGDDVEPDAGEGVAG